MRRFAEIVDDLELVDLPLQGGEFTWNGGLNNQAWARLDRFLVSPSWLDLFSGVTQVRLSRPISNHFPIVLEGGGIRRGPTPFRFENMWLKVEGFQDMVRTWWQGIDVRGSASYKLAFKMKEIKKKLKVWNKEVFGRLETNKASALEQVDFWDRVESERNLTVEEADLKKDAKDSFKKWVLLEEAHWRQHSREIWLREGDRNTGFFHRMASAHRRNNVMGRIKADIGNIQVGRISQQEAESLEIPFVEIEIHLALMEMNGDKAPDPDGFIVAFWQNAWDFTKEEIMEMFKEFHEHNSFVRSLNNTFLVLIPKKSGAEDLGDFRPISLLEGLYKLLAKVLANRLKKVIGKVVSIAQNAFVMGRQILDASLIANEVIDSWQKRKEKGLICKLDIEKAYDSINWNFLMKVLQKMGFGTKWVGWMWSCVSSAKFSILVNGVLAGFFLNTRGLRQGDPLSPYLFVMGMEILDVLIRRAVEGDILQAASGLRINLAKSEIIPVGEVEEILEIAAELGCRVGSLPSQYLGLPLGVPNRASSMWDGVEEKVRRRLALWKRQYISKGGRITLIKSTLAKKFNGGLGLRRIATLNRALLGKWIWRFACEKDNLWKYGQEDYGWRAKKASGAAGVGVWKEIMKESEWPSMEDDSVIWRQGRNGLFRVKEAYRLLDKPNATEFPARGIWVDRVPTKVCFFAWEATWGKVLTLDRLQIRGGRKGKRFGNPFRCVFFGRFGRRGIGEESFSLIGFLEWIAST
ncbi:Transposon TX1 uncharacterized 149 kDa protein [Vitis vinifera]|uniref:Transposon TX1 uncharacterized 149 kDa protein n=1 Tax=Vitis vinifera TaxID=29760 RepID=A0A438ILS3_VITVI|nr:Transposon TX1 uncharacterized 149 kDa protein [Vitis vinifera]